MQIPAQTDNHKYRKSAAIKKNYAVLKNGSQASKGKIQHFMQKSIYFFIKCQPSGV